MGDLTKLEINDNTGVFKNVNDLLYELRNNNIEAVAIVYSRKSDQSVRTFRSGYDRMVLIGIIEQLKYDLLNSDESVSIDYDEGL